MRILATSDLHYNLRQYDWVARMASGFDLVVIAGDLLDIAGHADLDTQIVVVRKYLQGIREQTTLIVSSGNHDGDATTVGDEFVADWLQNARANNLHVDGDSVMIFDDVFTVCPWWDGPSTRESMCEMLRQAADTPRRNWFWLHHAPPDGSPVSWTGKVHFGDPHLNQQIAERQPQFVFSGHVHASPFRRGGSWVDRIGETWVFNPGCEMGAVPAHIVLDLSAMRATWISSMGEESVDLGAPLDLRSTSEA